MHARDVGDPAREDLGLEEGLGLSAGDVCNAASVSSYMLARVWKTIQSALDSSLTKRPVLCRRASPSSQRQILERGT